MGLNHVVMGSTPTDSGGPYGYTYFCAAKLTWFFVRYQYLLFITLLLKWTSVEINMFTDS